MAVINWVSSSGGDWLTAADWSGGVVPGAGDDAQIEVPDITVTISSGQLAVAELTTIGSTLSMDGTASLTIDGVAAIGGAFLQSAGTLTLSGTLSTFGSLVDQTGGSIYLNNGLLVADGAYQEDGGTLTLASQGGTFGNTLEQSAGLITLEGNQLTALQGFTQTGGLLDLSGSALLYGSVSQTGSATIDQLGGLITDNGSFTETGGTLSLAGNGAIFNGAVSVQSGSITEHSGQFVSNSSLAMSGGAITLLANGAIFYGSVNQTGGVISLDNGNLTSYGAFTENGGSLSLGYGGGAFAALALESGNISSTAATLWVAGPFAQTGGTLSVLGRDTILAGTFTEGTAGSITVQSGALALEGNGTLAGTISGTGKILVESGSTTIASTAKISLPSIEVFGGTLTYATGATINQALLIDPNGRLFTNGQTLTLATQSDLNGELIGTTNVVMKGGGVIAPLGFSLDGTSHFYLASTASQTGVISLGNAGGSRTLFDILAVGTLHIAGNLDMVDQSGNGELLIAGSLVKTGGSGTAIVDTNVTDTGHVVVNIGTLLFEGPQSSFGGTISGAGTFAIAGGQNSFASTLALTVQRFALDQGSEQLTLAHNLSYAGEWSQLGGTLWLNGTNVTVATSGETGLDGGLVTGSGIFSTSASAPVNISGIDFEGTSTLKVAGAVNQTSSVGFGDQIGSAPVLDIASTAVWTIDNNGSLGGQVNSPGFENGTFVNDGTVQKLNGSSNSFIAGDFINAGTLDIANSIITLNGSGTLGGTLEGNGVLNLEGEYTLASGLTSSIHVIDVLTGVTMLQGNFADANTWAQASTQGTVDLNGFNLTLSGLVSLEGGWLSGPGTLTTSSNTVLGDNYVIGNGTLAVTGHADQVGDISVGDFSGLAGPPQPGALPPSVATLEVAAGATYVLDDSNNIGSNGTLAIAGTFTALGGGASLIGPSVIDTGVINAGSAALRFIGPVSGDGSIVIGAGGSLDFVGSVAASTTISFTTGTGSMFLEDPIPNTNILSFEASVAGFQTGDFIEFSNLQQNLSQLHMSFNAAGTVLTLTDNNHDSDSITFTSAQNTAALSLGFGPHNDITLFHL